MKSLLYTLLCASVLVFAACCSPAHEITEHFKYMTEIAKAYPHDCDGMGNALNKYLTKNHDKFSRSVNKTGSSTTDESKALYISSFELNEATAHCQNDSMDAFRRSLAEITLKNVEMPAPKPAPYAAPAKN